MVEEPNFDYKYDLVLWKSFSARLSLVILAIAAGVFLMAMLAYLYFSEERVMEMTAMKAKAQLHDAVLDMRLKSMQAVVNNDSLSNEEFFKILEGVKPYEHSFTAMADSTKHFVFLGDNSLVESPKEDVNEILTEVTSGKSGMRVVVDKSKQSLIIYEPVYCNGLYAAVICSRTDIIAGYKSLIFYGVAVFIIGLIILFSCCAFAIYRMVRPLHLFAQSAINIAEGNLDAPLPEIQSQDELMNLRSAFAHMQTSLKQYIEDLKVTTATKEHMQSELTIAHDIQMGMIPKVFPKHDEIDVFASMVPAKQVGGDLYDFLIDNNELFFIVGDVAGKGVPASLYMAVTRTLFRNLAGNYQSAANVVREINHAIASTNDSCIFVTLLVGVLDLKTHVLAFCNASHNPPLLIPHEGKCRFLEMEPNVPVGVVDRYSYEEYLIDFSPGSSLLLYTDGLTEAVNDKNEFFGEDRLLEEADSCRGIEAQNAVSFLKRRVNAFVNGAEQSDDLTMLFLHHKMHETEVSQTNSILLKNEMAELERLRCFIFSICREHGADEDFASMVNLATEEAVVNVVNYAYPKGTRGNIKIEVEVSNSCLTLSIKDQGVPFDPTAAPEPDIEAELDERSIGGLGIHMIRSIMDSMEYQRTEDGSNLLILTKNF